jgi:hypothetical protein
MSQMLVDDGVVRIAGSEGSESGVAKFKRELAHPAARDREVVTSYVCNPTLTSPHRMQQSANGTRYHCSPEPKQAAEFRSRCIGYRTPSQPRLLGQLCVSHETHISILIMFFQDCINSLITVHVLLHRVFLFVYLDKLCNRLIVTCIHVRRCQPFQNPTSFRRMFGIPRTASA